jgi:hypothetical protein
MIYILKGEIAMDFFNYIDKTCELQISEATHEATICYDKAMIDLKTLCINRTFMESVDEYTVDAVYETTVKDLAEKVKKTINDIIKSIKGLIDKAKQKLFGKTEDKNAVAASAELVKNIKSVPNADLKVDVYSSEEYKKILNDYLREMLALERKLQRVKQVERFGGKKGNVGTIECQEIFREMDKLNEKFDKEFLDANEKTIQMAKRDAIRFNDKQLKTVKVDFDALQADSEKILEAFKKDADGCEVPEKLNLFQKMSSSVATATRKVTTKMSQNYSKTLSSVLIFAAAGAAIHNPILREKGKEFGKKAVTKIQSANADLRAENERLMNDLKNG